MALVLISFSVSNGKQRDTECWVILGQKAAPSQPKHGREQKFYCC